jgi:hypothetical protein
MQRCFLLGPPRGYITRIPQPAEGMGRVQLWDTRRTRWALVREAEEYPQLISVTMNGR